MKVHFITHESFEAPAAIAHWAEAAGHDLSYTRLYDGDRLPEHCDMDFLVVMGGPQSPATTTKECPHFDGPKEIAFVKSAIDGGRLVLGVCLGAQIIGEALGARFDHSPHREIGVFPLHLTEEGSRDPFIGIFPATLDVGHWHGDMPGVTPEAEILAVSAGCPRQIVRYSPSVYGFQCHFEFTLDAVEGMIRSCSSELSDFGNLPYVQSPDELRSHDYAEINGRLFQFLDKFTATRASNRL